MRARNIERMQAADRDHDSFLDQIDRSKQKRAARGGQSKAGVELGKGHKEYNRENGVPLGKDQIQKAELVEKFGDRAVTDYNKPLFGEAGADITDQYEQLAEEQDRLLVKSDAESKFRVRSHDGSKESTKAYDRA